VARSWERPLSEQRTQPFRDRERTRVALIEAARAVFAAKGFDGGSLDEIAERAGFTRGAIHFHFASKEDLFLAVMKQRNVELLSGYQVDTASGPLLDPEAVSRRWRELHADVDADLALRNELHSLARRNESMRRCVLDLEREAVSATSARLADQVAASGRSLRYPLRDVAELLHVVSAALLEQHALTGRDVAPLMGTFLRMITATDDAR
jgi:AcrR family transcriptional regulator